MRTDEGKPFGLLGVCAYRKRTDLIGNFLPPSPLQKKLALLKSATINLAHHCGLLHRTSPATTCLSNITVLLSGAMTVNCRIAR